MVATKYGRVDLAHWRTMPGHEKRRILMNAVDITDRCVWFNDQTHEALCFVLDANGFARGAQGELVTEHLHGRVTFKELK